MFLCKGLEAGSCLRSVLEALTQPAGMQALRDTFVVIGIVGGLSVLLFITNSTFTELSKVVYKS